MNNLINIKEEHKWVEDHKFMFEYDYSTEIIRNDNWSIKVLLIDYSIWYECYKLDYRYLSSGYDYSSESLKDVLEYCNDIIDNSFIYY